MRSYLDVIPEVEKVKPGKTRAGCRVCHKALASHGIVELRRCSMQLDSERAEQKRAAEVEAEQWRLIAKLSK